MVFGHSLLSHHRCDYLLGTFLRGFAASPPTLVYASGNRLVAALELTFMFMLVQVFSDFLLNLRAILGHNFPPLQFQL